MCGGKATRMKADIEKPLVKVGNVPMIDRVISAITDSGMFDRIVVAVSPNAPKTKELVKLKGLDIVETAGNGFSQDLSFLPKFKLARVLVIPADLPLLNSKIVREIVSIAQTSAGAVAISITIEKEFVENIGVKPSVVVCDKNNDKYYCHSGITIFDTARIGDNNSSSSSLLVKEEYKIMNKVEVAVNVNTKEELELAEKLLLIQDAQDLAKNFSL